MKVEIFNEFETQVLMLAEMIVFGIVTPCGPVCGY